MRPLRTAVVGTGHLGQAHARILSQSDHSDLVAVVDSDAARCNEIAQLYGAQPCACISEMPSAVEAVVVATPTVTHHAIGRELLARGMHVLVEKPLAPNSTEAYDLVDAAASAGVVLQVGHVERFNPALTAARGRIGEPKFIEATRSSGYTFRSTDIGVVLDLMIHDIDIVLSLTRSKVVRVEAIGVAVLGTHEDVANARLELADGCVASLSASRVSYAAQRNVRVWSPHCFASFDLGAREARIVSPSDAIQRRTCDLDHLNADEKQAFRDEMFQRHLAIEDLSVEACDQLTAELDDFADAIRRGRQPRVTGAQGAEAVSVAEQILASIESHAWDTSESPRQGPLAIPHPRVIPGPHWSTKPSPVVPRRQAG